MFGSFSATNAATYFCLVLKGIFPVFMTHLVKWRSGGMIKLTNMVWSITNYLLNCLLHWYLLLDPPTIQNVTTSSKKSWIGQTVTLKCLSDGVPTPTLSWYKPKGSEINRVTAREIKIQVPLRGDQDFGHYKCIAANGLIPSDQKLITINQISK